MTPYFIRSYGQISEANNPKYSNKAIKSNSAIIKDPFKSKLQNKALEISIYDDRLLIFKRRTIIARKHFSLFYRHLTMKIIN